MMDSVRLQQSPSPDRAIGVYGGQSGVHAHGGSVPPTGLPAGKYGYDSAQKPCILVATIECSGGHVTPAAGCSQLPQPPSCWPRLTPVHRPMLRPRPPLLRPAIPTAPGRPSGWLRCAVCPGLSNACPALETKERCSLPCLCRVCVPHSFCVVVQMAMQQEEAGHPGGGLAPLRIPAWTPGNPGSQNVSYWGQSPPGTSHHQLDAYQGLLLSPYDTPPSAFESGPFQPNSGEPPCIPSPGRRVQIRLRGSGDWTPCCDCHDTACPETHARSLPGLKRIADGCRVATQPKTRRRRSWTLWQPRRGSLTAPPPAPGRCRAPLQTLPKARLPSCHACVWR